MGQAMLEGWLERGLDPGAVVVFDPLASDALHALAQTHQIRLNPSAADVEPPDVLVLAIKPQSLDAAAPGLDSFISERTLVLSILAGKTLANLTDRLPRTSAVVRAMPNLPAAIGRGASAAVASPATTAAQRAMAHALLGAVGLVAWLDDEALIDAVTGLSGSGPAYVFHMVEAMTAAGRAAGLPGALAARLARATVTGAAAMLDQSSLSPENLRQNVTSPGGTTAAALTILMDGEAGLSPLMTRAVAAAARRAGELSG